MGFFDKLFGTNKIESDDVTRVIILLDEVMKISVTAEKEATLANSSMPSGLGARISNQRNEILDSALETNKIISQMMTTLEQIEKVTKKGISVERSECDEKNKRIAKIFIKIYYSVNDMKKMVKSTLIITREAANKAIKDVDAAFLSSHKGMGEGFINSNRGSLTNSQERAFLNEQRRVDELANNAKKTAEGARELRSKAYNAVVALKKKTDSLQELRNCLSGGDTPTPGYKVTSKFPIF